ncbi:hypothetical protein HNQ09_002177 [Deinococcus budaensis]|uniref:Uncharacterized protein n=1 Tax=Deinococcus budaensis TaxID=1665626 RepID=A0A7W8GG59_9DEIO|nr:hypothetical protein [Deinococcus budaensis]MBB5234734.1 hypothetical protein [Deinococcus budaensis]
MNPPRDKLSLQTLLSAAVLVPSMTFVVMPRRGWLLRGPQAAPSRAQSRAQEV